ncbi:transport and Golgi organization protein 2 isoform X1 [Stomoxys calcitrans]|uniref:transport and Golgi organization protein 2 isoform X1 n=1 Tax=Stomoxys calcitrans TaxID=35570 RepID=UPI0027E3A548|nr:transport and Golgi organization protein 2 isoform X1 [Stomoxys calcitrans]XP_059222900.1 transport and Golgi organization protein 2 isoform X1 [Stomoxys calcitrans]
MCVIFFYVNSNPQVNGYKLILASNRDEFYARDTKEVAKWQNVENCYGGIDMEPGREGGTWLAISGQDGIFKIAALLNLTGEPKPRNAVGARGHPLNSLFGHGSFFFNHNILLHNQHTQEQQESSKSPTTQTINGYKPPSQSTEQIDPHPLTCPQSSLQHNNNSLLGRGMLVSDYVSNYTEGFDHVNYNRSLLADCSKYSAFNFVSIEIGPSTRPALVTLCSNAPASLVEYKENTCYGFGNSLPSAPFEKVRYGRNRFQKIVEKFQKEQQPSQNELIDQLMELLKCKEKFWPDAELMRRAPNWGEHLSALNVCVPGHGYGSRTHTVILVDAHNKMHFIEETMKTQDPEGEWSRHHIETQYLF